MDIDGGWVIGLLLAMTRVTGFTIASPMLSKAVPFAGRTAFVVAAGLAFAEPVGGSVGIWQLIEMALINTVVGIILGFLTGILFHLFDIAGNMIDFTSSLATAQTLDPMTGSRAGVFGRVFNLTALTIFFAIGGHRLLVKGLQLSIESIPLNGRLDLDPGLAEVALDAVSLMMVAAVEVAVPAITALFLAELLLGLASKFAPQANVFLLGLPAKIVAALATVSFVVLVFPEAVSGVIEHMEETFSQVIRGMSGSA